MNNSDAVRIVQGENVWRILRTDRDGASRGEVLEMAGQFMRWALAPANQTGEPWELLSTGDLEWRVGAARPILALEAGHTPQPLPAGTPMGDRRFAVPDTIPTVRGQRPWFLLVRFYWRAPSVTVPWPSLLVSTLGFRSREHNGADWTLDRAVAVAAPSELEEDDRTWGEDQAERAKNAAKELVSGGTSLVKVAVIVAGTVGVVYALSRVLPRSRTR